MIAVIFVRTGMRHNGRYDEPTMHIRRDPIPRNGDQVSLSTIWNRKNKAKLKGDLCHDMQINKKKKHADIASDS